MRILLLADVHANWEALLALQRAEPQPDAVLFAGDAVGFGPHAAHCVRWLAANATVCVRGEYDDALLNGTGHWDEMSEQTLALARAQLANVDRAALSGWPLVRAWEKSGARFLIAHGTPARPLDQAIEVATASEDALTACLGPHHADFVVLGRSHVPAIRRSGSTLFINPGSLGLPLHGFPDATYGVWDEGQVQIKHLHYDHDATARHLRLAPLSAEVVEQLTEILSTGLAESTP